MKNQDCDLCFYKFANKSQQYCVFFEKRIENCKKFKNDIVINGMSYNFINPLTAPCLDKMAKR